MQTHLKQENSPLEELLNKRVFKHYLIEETFLMSYAERCIHNKMKDRNMTENT